jgi:hypothetical protein
LGPNNDDDDDCVEGRCADDDCVGGRCVADDDDDASAAVAENWWCALQGVDT